MIVVDATIAAKWYLIEADSSAALAVIAGVQDPLSAPDLIQLEVTGAIARRHRMGGVSRSEAAALIADWNRDIGRGRIELEAWQHLLDDAAALALTISHSVVDCLYLALAMRRSAPLLTADERLYRRGSIAYDAVRLL
jgi:predicted nucleic acid-binding protein